MHHQLHRGLAIISLIFLAACQTPAQKMTRLWLYTHYTGQPYAKQLRFSPASFVLLEANGQYTKDFGTFGTGHWQLVNNQLILTNETKGSHSYAADTDGKELRLTTSTGQLVNFEAATVDMANKAANPFDRVNNRWRVKAAHKESDQELKARMLNHLQYWVVYFTWAEDNNLSMVDVRSAPSPIKIYGNGLVVKPLSQLPNDWIQLFYDEQDCARVTRTLEAFLKTHTITWSQTQHKYKMFISAFQQLRDGLR